MFVFRSETALDRVERGMRHRAQPIAASLFRNGIPQCVQFRVHLLGEGHPFGVHLVDPSVAFCSASIERRFKTGFAVVKCIGIAATTIFANRIMVSRPFGECGTFFVVHLIWHSLQWS